jgi:hypothetical protein
MQQQRQHQLIPYSAEQRGPFRAQQCRIGAVVLLLLCIIQAGYKSACCPWLALQETGGIGDWQQYGSELSKGLV